MVSAVSIQRRDGDEKMALTLSVTFAARAFPVTDSIQFIALVGLAKTIQSYVLALNSPSGSYAHIEHENWLSQH